MVGENVEGGKRVIRVVIGEERVEDMHKDGNLQNSLVSEEWAL